MEHGPVEFDGVTRLLSVRLRRVSAAVGAVATIAAGLVVHSLLPDTAVSDAAGDALYAVLIYLLVVVAMPRWGTLLCGGFALAWCTAVELFQLTGLPEVWGAAFAPAMLVLGTVFSPVDLVVYTVAVIGAATLDMIARMLAPASSRRRPAGEES